ncbi:MAG: ribosome modulation factor [Pontibacterium sp.]
MKRQKRDRSSTLFNRGFNAGIDGKSRDNCPVNTLELRSHWMNGWREGREAHWNGQEGVSAIQINPSLH